eukprot:gene11236-biopygen12693
MTLANLQESGLEVGTGTQEAQHSPKVGLIPYRYIPSSCVYLLLAAMDKRTRQTFRAVSSSCRKSVNAYATALRHGSFLNDPRQSRESVPIPKCPNVRSVDIFHPHSLCFSSPFPASVLKATFSVYERLCNGVLRECNIDPVSL